MVESVNSLQKFIRCCFAKLAVQRIFLTNTVGCVYNVSHWRGWLLSHLHPSWTWAQRRNNMNHKVFISWCTSFYNSQVCLSLVA